MIRPSARSLKKSNSSDVARSDPSVINNNNNNSNNVVNNNNSNVNSNKAGLAPTSNHVSLRRGAGVPSVKVPFVCIFVFLFFILVSMGVMSIYSMLYLTDSVHKPAPTTYLRPKIKAKKLIQDVRQEFYDRYGGEKQALKLFQSGISAYGNINTTAYRMLQAKVNQRPFVFGFSGYSITVGRGNFFNQSFPFVMERVLQFPMEQILNVPLIVRNGAIGGIPSFPYGFCLEHFLGNDIDVLSWDYSMNEGPKDASVLESFIRQSLQQLPNHPMMIVLDTNPLRKNLLQTYTKKDLLHDAIAVSKGEIVDKNIFENTKQSNLPIGFQNWDKFGAPDNCPGRGSWHPKYKEHELIGWMIAMHFIDALERVVEILEQRDWHKQMQQTLLAQRQTGSSHLSFPSPVTKVNSNNGPQVIELLYGHVNENDKSKYIMKDISCRTSFLPATDHSKVIPSIVVSGLAPGIVDMDIMNDRPDSLYQAGWVLDVSKTERDTKRKVERCGGLGYIDLKIALYGIPKSGPLRLWLPYEGPEHDHDHDHDDDFLASHWFDELILCEANEKRGDDACHLDSDLELTIGGEKVSKISHVLSAAEYLKRKTCVHVEIPSKSKVTLLQDVTTTNGEALSEEQKVLLGGTDNPARVGLVVDVKAKSRVTRADGACCLSHIVWEQH